LFPDGISANATHTAGMILRIDQLCDSFNGAKAAPKPHNPLEEEPHRKPYRVAVEEDSFHFQFWDETVKWIKEWSFEAAATGKKCKSMPFQVSRETSNAAN